MNLYAKVSKELFLLPSPIVFVDLVVDGGDGLQIRRVAANILNKHSRTANKR
jgi:hypothetical protein